MESLTCCVCSWNAKYALALMWESYCRFNADFPAKLMVLDNGSFDGANAYALRHADYVLIGDNTRNHGVGLTEMARRVETEYLLVSDNDIRSIASGGMAYLMSHMREDTWCVCPNRPGMEKGDLIDPTRCIGYSPNICIGLFRTSTIQKICRTLDLGYAGDFTTGRVWETGGLAWHVAQTHGLDSVELPGAWEYFDHYGNMSQLWCHVPNYPSEEGMNLTLPHWAKESYFQRYERVKTDLAAVRGCRVEELDAHEPPCKVEPIVEKLEWGRIEHYHPFLTYGAGVR